MQCHPLCTRHAQFKATQSCVLVVASYVILLSLAGEATGQEHVASVGSTTPFDF